MSLQFRSLLLPGLVLGSLAVAGCSDVEAAAEVVADVTASATDAGPAPFVLPSMAASPPRETPEPAAQQPSITNLPPNELGQIMVLEYHRIGDKESEWTRSAENFRKDLQALYERGYRPITMRQMVQGDIDLPRGATPVVFTIDDSSIGQFYYLPDGSIDPNSMAGMWSAFQKKKRDWKNGAVWCVLPAADHPSNFFGEKPSREVPRAEREATIRKKVDYLVENGHEICNHTLYHARLDKGTDAQVQEWLGRGEDSIQVYLPAGYDIVTHALPLGMWPKNRSLAWKGEWKGKPYSYEAVLEVSGGPSVSPFDKAWNPRSINRLIVAPGALRRQLEAYDQNPGRRYVSDGLPGSVSYPQGEEGRLDRSRLKGKKAVPVAPPATTTAGDAKSP